MLGDVVYWTASIVALLLAFFGFISIWRYSPDSFSTYSVIAGLIWLAGKAARYLLADR